MELRIVLKKFGRDVHLGIAVKDSSMIKFKFVTRYDFEDVSGFLT